MESTFEKLKELDLTRDEIERFGDALKKPEFRKLLHDYVEEINDPENKKLYEKEITELERERGNDITFIHPEACYVIKTSVNGTKKAFVNICTNQLVEKPSSSPTVKDGERGLTWRLPHSLSPPREDLDKKHVRCQVFDVVFHPDTMHLASKNQAFRDMVNRTALDAVEKNFDVTLDKKNLKYPKLSYKGVAHPSVIKKPCEKPERTPEEKELFERLFPAETPDASPTKPKKPTRKTVDDEKSRYTTPQYLIKHRSHIEMEQFTEHKEAKMNAAIPKELIVEVNLPLLKSSADIDLDVTNKTIQLVSEKPAKYKLNLTLPYQVNESIGNAKFDKDRKKLVIVLPVKRNAASMEFSDSGIESDQCSPGTPESEEESDKRLVEEIESTPSEVVEPDNKPVDFRTHFLDENLHYNLPEFTCHVFENCIAFTLNVKNVDENSVEKAFCDENSSIRLKFTSISSSFYPTHYTCYVKLPQHVINIESTTVEVWDNNVILQVIVNCDNHIVSYLFGSTEDDLVEKFVEEPEVINKVLEGGEDKNDSEQTVLEPSIHGNEPEQKQQNVKEPAQERKERKDSFEENCGPKPTKAIDITGTSYESSGDELSCSSFSPSKNKGILKRFSSGRFSVGRSISESSLDNFVYSSVENCHTSLDSVIPEDGEVSSSEKKTVRFNDVVMSQLFRSNSSILGQKKKNQRKARNKKRALERRHSESEASGDEKKEGDLRDCDDFKKSECFEKKDENIFHLEVDN
ncbi:unnamed protein product [Phyllotreta striolata]|uniref:Protein kintoun n=1 Tax=Phyllotreta striolata TaxID=444603 RepID=A0A9N9U1V8_PHYSR|nr:unnamed protein product [Phyllotreta striolata]